MCSDIFLRFFSQIFKHKQRTKAGDVDIHLDLYTKHYTDCWFINMIIEKVCVSEDEKWKENLCRLGHLDI